MKNVTTADKTVLLNFNSFPHITNQDFQYWNTFVKKPPSLWYSMIKIREKLQQIMMNSAQWAPFKRSPIPLRMPNNEPLQRPPTPAPTHQWHPSKLTRSFLGMAQKTHQSELWYLVNDYCLFNLLQVWISRPPWNTCWPALSNVCDWLVPFPLLKHQLRSRYGLQGGHLYIWRTLHHGRIPKQGWSSALDGPHLHILDRDIIYIYICTHFIIYISTFTIENYISLLAMQCSCTDLHKQNINGQLSVVHLKLQNING